MEIGKCWRDAFVDDDEEKRREVVNGMAAYIDNCVDNGLFSNTSLCAKVAVKHW